MSDERKGTSEDPRKLKRKSHNRSARYQLNCLFICIFITFTFRSYYKRKTFKYLNKFFLLHATVKNLYEEKLQK